MYQQSDAAWGIHKHLQEEYYKMYEARNNLHGLLIALGYVCQGLEQPTKICDNAIEASKDASSCIDKIIDILEPFNKYGFRDKYNE